MADSAAPPKTMMDLAPSLRSPGFRLVDAGELYALLNSIFSNQAGIAARGNTAATAFKITAAVNSVATTSGANNGLMLPLGLPGKQVTIVNNGAVSVTVYANGADQIEPIGSSVPAASLTQAAGTTGVYLCIARTLNPTVNYWKQVSVG